MHIPFEHRDAYDFLKAIKNKYLSDDDLVINLGDEIDGNQGDTYICHGKTSAYGKLAKEMGANAVQGHFHGKFEITWHKSLNIERYNIFSGCLVDRENLAFAYGKNHIPKPILGATILSENGYPSLVKMTTTDKDRWTGKLP